MNEEPLKWLLDHYSTLISVFINLEFILNFSSIVQRMNSMPTCAQLDYRVHDIQSCTRRRRVSAGMCCA